MTQHNETRRETATFTPGPWTAGLDEDRRHHALPVMASGLEGKILVAQVRPTHCGWATATTNARLIASAPDLLEACQTLLEAEEAMIGTDYGNELLAKAIKQARLAVVKTQPPCSNY